MKAASQIKPFPKARRLAPDIGWLSRNRYAILGLLEIDVTVPRQAIREYETRSGEKLSFTSFLAGCVGQAVDEEKSIHAMRNWKGDLVIFEDVDISILVEREKDGKKYPLAHIVRSANRKSVREIHDEIRLVQGLPPSNAETNSLKAIVSLPRFIRRFMLWLVSKNPSMRKQNLGTVTLSAIGMFGNKAGWALAPNLHPLGLLVGSIVQKPAFVDGRVESREYLYLTLEFDHEVIDGAPAARFANRLVDLIECGYGLAEAFSSPGT